MRRSAKITMTNEVANDSGLRCRSRSCSRASSEEEFHSPSTSGDHHAPPKVIKVWVFWEGHKIWKKSSSYFWLERRFLCAEQRTCQKVDKDFFLNVDKSYYTNFKILLCGDRLLSWRTVHCSISVRGKAVVNPNEMTLRYTITMLQGS